MLMRPEVQRRLKQRSKEMGVPIGTMIENLMSSLEFRLKHWAQVLHKNVHELAEDHVFKMTFALWQDDRVGGGTTNIVEAVNQIRVELVEREEKSLEWEPDIRLTGTDFIEAKKAESDTESNE